MPTLEEQIKRFADEALPSDDLFVVEVRISGREGRRTINVFVDGDNAPSIDTLADMSRELGFLIDAEDVVTGSYRLNVSSPGVDRPLLLPRQFPKHVGRTLTVRLGGSEGDALEGALTAASDSGIVLDTGDGSTELGYDDFQDARVKLPW